MASFEDAQRRLVAARLVHTLDHRRALEEVAPIVDAGHDSRRRPEQFDRNQAHGRAHTSTYRFD